MGEYDGHRERLKNHYRDHGMDALRDYEVLELLLFYAVPRKDTQPVARKLLAHFGSIAAVLDAAPQELKDVSGLSDNAILLLQMMPALSRRYLVSRSEVGVVLDSTKATGQFIVPYFHGEMDEVIYLLCLDSKQKLTACRQLQRGNINTVPLSIRKAVEIALHANAASVILAHNHPGGVALPSNADYAATDQLTEALAPLGIALLDHVIVSDGDYVSLLDNGYIRTP